MWNFPYFWKAKFGISDAPKLRRAQVDESTAGAVGVFLALPISFGWWAEQAVHGMYFWANAPFAKGSGRSEWFVVLNPVFGSAFYFASRYAGISWPAWAYALAAFFPFVWIDGLLWLLIFFVARQAIFLGLAALSLYFISQL